MVSATAPVPPVAANNQLVFSGPKFIACLRYSAKIEKKYVTAKMNRKWRMMRLRVRGWIQISFAAIAMLNSSFFLCFSSEETSASNRC